jgi:hypothetical protein
MPSRVASRISSARGQHGVDQRVVVLDAERDDAARRGLLNARSSVFFTDALRVAVRHNHHRRRLHRADTGDLLARLQLDEVDDRLALALRSDLWDLMDLEQ